MSETQTQEQTQQTTQTQQQSGEKTYTAAEVDELVKSRIGAALAAQKKTPAQPPPDYEELKAFKLEQERKALEAKGEYQKALDAQAESIKGQYEPELKKRDETIHTVTSRLRKEVVDNQLLAAAAKGNAVNAEQVVALLSTQVRVNDHFEPEVVNPDGTPRFLGKDPMTPAQLVEDFLRNNPHFVKAPAGAKGGGATGGVAAHGGAELSPVAQKEKEVAELEAEAMRTGAPLALSRHARAAKELAALKAKTH